MIEVGSIGIRLKIRAYNAVDCTSLGAPELNLSTLNL